MKETNVPAKLEKYLNTLQGNPSLLLLLKNFFKEFPQYTPSNDLNAFSGFLDELLKNPKLNNLLPEVNCITRSNQDSPNSSPAFKDSQEYADYQKQALLIVKSNLLIDYFLDKIKQEEPNVSLDWPSTFNGLGEAIHSLGMLFMNELDTTCATNYSLLSLISLGLKTLTDAISYCPTDLKPTIYLKKETESAQEDYFPNGNLTIYHGAPALTLTAKLFGSLESKGLPNYMAGIGENDFFPYIVCDDDISIKVHYPKILGVEFNPRHQ